MKLAVVIMAAGKGTRLKSQRPKVLHEIGGKPLLAHVIAAASKHRGASGIFVVVGHQAERVKAAVAATRAFASSSKPSSAAPATPSSAPARPSPATRTFWCSPATCR
jgi:bifunctional UDP-N-acetylglucosamine pyrophosphorylase/glucosamine-1-phosphate N-acetyltransferase